MNKKELREEINSYLKELLPLELDSMSRKVTDCITSEQLWRESSEILIFLSFGKELETKYIIEKALDEGKKVAVPRVYGKEMKFHYLNSLSDKLETSSWGIREPLATSEHWAPGTDQTLMVTPGLAFGLNGERLGRGGGFYDRFLSRYKDRLVTVGICFEEQIRSDIPVAPHDILLNALCSDRRFISPIGKAPC